jgi:hypothetical protein
MLLEFIVIEESALQKAVFRDALQVNFLIDYVDETIADRDEMFTCNNIVDLPSYQSAWILQSPSPQAGSVVTLHKKLFTYVSADGSEEIEGKLRINADEVRFGFHTLHIYGELRGSDTFNLMLAAGALPLFLDDEPQFARNYVVDSQSNSMTISLLDGGVVSEEYPFILQ